MPQQQYSGYVSNALGLNYTRNVSLSGGGAGSGQINWVKLTLGLSTNAYGKTYDISVTLKWPGGSATGRRSDIKMNSSNYSQAYFDFWFPNHVGLNNLESFDVIAHADGSSVFVKGSQSVTVDYTVPTRVTAPTAVSLSTQTVPPGGAATLSWYGAQGGVVNDIKHYEVYRSTSPNSGYELLGTTSGTSMTVYGHPEPNNKYYYKVKTIGTYGGLDSDLSSAYTMLDTPVTAVTAPTTVSVNPTSVAPDGNATLSWTGHAAGTNNPIKYFEVWRSPTSSSSGFEYLGIVAGNKNSLVVQGRSEPNKSYWYKIKAIGTRDGFDSPMSSAFAKLDAPVTAVSAPTAASVPSISENTPYLTFSGAASGTNNAIIGYEIEYAQSNNGTSWGSWTELKTINHTQPSGSTLVDLPDARGRYRKYRIRTLGAAGASFNSGWKETGAVKYNTPPTAPTHCIASPEVYVSGPIALSYGGASDVDNNLGDYQVQYAIMSGGVLGAWNNLPNNATSHTPTLGLNESVKYRVRATDTLGAVSSYVESGLCGKNTPPVSPSVDYPVSGRTTLNPRPRFLLTVGQDYEDNTQSLQSAGYTFSRSSGLMMGDKVIARKVTPANPGAIEIQLNALDKHGEASAVTTRSATYVAPAYTDPQTVAGTTRIKAVHINELRNNINIMRQYYGLNAKAWSETVVAGHTSTRNWAAHITEMREAIKDIINQVNGWDINSNALNITQPNWIPLTQRPSAPIMAQLRQVIENL
ncbi:MAG: hypothetical protein ACOX7B_03260 [Christensenellales bacterium]|jgi:hypothetical protein